MVNIASHSTHNGGYALRVKISERQNHLLTLLDMAFYNVCHQHHQVLATGPIFARLGVSRPQEVQESDGKT